MKKTEKKVDPDEEKKQKEGLQQLTLEWKLP